MILVDTSVWVFHLRRGDSRLRKLLVEGRVLCHRFVIGELACGDLDNRSEILGLLQALPTTPSVDEDEILSFIEQRQLMGTGLGLVDVHLLASALLARALLWSVDRRLQSAAGRLNLLYR